MARSKARVEVEDKELSTFVQIIEPDFPSLAPREKATVITIVTGFLNSLDKRELDAQAKTAIAIDRLDLGKLTNKDGLVTIKSQRDADLAGEICNDLAATSREIGESWDKETKFFHQFHKTLTGRRGKCQKVLETTITSLKGGARIWLLREQTRIREAEKKANREVPEGAPPISLNKPKIEGLSGKTKWRHRVPDFMTLVKAVARGKAPLGAIQENSDWLKGDATLNHDRAIKDEKTGKMYLYDGTVEIFEDLDMARR